MKVIYLDLLISYYLSYLILFEALWNVCSTEGREAATHTYGLSYFIVEYRLLQENTKMK
jgi:hypothetical protein